MTRDVAGEQGFLAPQIPEHLYFLLLVDLSHCLCAPSPGRGSDPHPRGPSARMSEQTLPSSGGGGWAAAIRQSHGELHQALCLGVGLLMIIVGGTTSQCLLFSG